jgi:hypothetical protein
MWQIPWPPGHCLLQEGCIAAVVSFPLELQNAPGAITFSVQAERQCFPCICLVMTLPNLSNAYQNKRTGYMLLCLTCPIVNRLKYALVMVAQR